MSNHLINEVDNVDYNINFLAGIYCLWQSKYTQARNFFLTAVYETTQLEKYYFIYHSYVGLSAVLVDHNNGVVGHCCNSSDKLISIEPEVQINLACAELIKGNRKNAIEAIDKFDGFVPTTGFNEIRSFYKIVGKRKNNTRSLLKRENFIRNSIGMIFRKRKNEDAKYIEEFIIKTSKNRYKRAIHNFNDVAYLMQN